MTHQTTVIFSIDAPSNHNKAAFERFMNGLVESSPLLDANCIKECRGSYNGVEEPSYIATKEVFDKYIRPSWYVQHQESVLVVSGCNKAYAHLEYLNSDLANFYGPYTEAQGSLCQVSEEVARKHNAWTHRIDTGNWYICAHINPDHSSELSGESNV